MFSIIICSISPERLLQVKKNIQETIGTEHEFIAIDNRETKWPIAKAYNEGAKRARYPYLFFVHEDVRFHSQDWGKVIAGKLEEPDCGAEQLIILVASGVIDYAVCDEAEARAIGDTYDAIDCQTDISFTQFMAWTLRQESTALCDSLNRWIDEISRTKEYKSLKEKYFGNPKKR